jgi:hypothetical protein
MVLGKVTRMHIKRETDMAYVAGHGNPCSREWLEWASRRNDGAQALDDGPACGPGVPLGSTSMRASSSSLLP